MFKFDLGMVGFLFDIIERMVLMMEKILSAINIFSKDKSKPVVTEGYKDLTKILKKFEKTQNESFNSSYAITIKHIDGTKDSIHFLNETLNVTNEGSKYMVALRHSTMEARILTARSIKNIGIGIMMPPDWLESDTSMPEFILRTDIARTETMTFMCATYSTKGIDFMKNAELTHTVQNIVDIYDYDAASVYGPEG